MDKEWFVTWQCRCEQLGKEAVPSMPYSRGETGLLTVVVVFTNVGEICL